MSILTKNALSASNQASFPDNTTGAITPLILRDYNQSVIDTLVDSLNTGSYAITTGSNDFTQPNSFTSISASSFVSASQFVGDGSKLTNITASTAIPISDEGILQGYATQLNFSGSNISASLNAGIATISVNTNDLITTSSFNSFTSSINSFTASQVTKDTTLATYTASVDTKFTAVGSSTASLNAYTQSNDTKWTTLGNLTGSLSSSVNQLNQFTSSQDTKNSTLASYTGSNNTKWDTLQMISSSWVTETESGSFLITASVSLNTITFTKGNNTTFAITVNTGSGGGGATDISALNAFTASQDTKNIAVQSSTSSLNSFTASAQTSLTNLNTFTSSQLTINSAIGASTSSLNTFSSSVLTQLSTLANVTSSLISKTGSYATTGSNTFVGNQTITGNITAFSASFTYLQTIYESSSVIYSSGSNQFGDELTDIQTLSGSVKVQGSLTVNGTPVQTSSVSITALNSFTASQETKDSTLATYTASVDTKFTAVGASTSSLNSATASLFTSSSLALVTASITGQTITFTKGDASQFNIVIPASSTSFTSSISISGSITISGSINNVDYIDFNTASAVPTWKSGRVYWDNTDGALSVYNAEADISMQLGQEMWVRVINNTGVTITNGSVVRLVGAVGDNPTIQLAQAIQVSGSVATDNQVLGLATHNIETGTNGYVTTLGNVHGLNTSAFTEGQVLWVSSSAGLLTNVVPSAPYERIAVATVVKAGPGTSGILYVAPVPPIDFATLSSVEISGSYSNGDMWLYEGNVWKHRLKTELGLTTTSSFNSYTSSTNSRLTNIESTTASLNTSVTNLNSFTASQDTKNATLASYTGSNDTKWSTLGTQTGSFVTETESGSFLITASFSGNTLTFTKGNNTTFGVVIPDVSGSTINTGSFATTGSNSFVGNQTITGSLILSSSNAVDLQIIGNMVVTGSAFGNVVSMSISSNTASMNLNTGNYFTLSIPTGTTRISPSNIQAGTSATLVITTASGSLVTFDSSVKQPSGSAYVPTSGSVDVLSFVSVNSSNLYVVSTKNMI